MLQPMMPGVYNWLLAHDRVWLQEHRNPQPSQRTSRAKVPITFWEQRDKALAEQVREFAARLRGIQDYPIFISKHAIAADLHQVRALDQLLDQLPLTAKALEDVCETRVAHVLRRLEWVAKDYLQQHLCPTRKQFIQRAGAAAWAKEPNVQEAVVTMLASLQSATNR